MLNIDLKNKIVFIAGIGDDQGYGWAIAKAMAEAGARIIVGTWVPLMKILSTSMSSGKFDQSRKLSSGKMMEFEKIYPLDAAFDTMDDVPQDILDNKRYKEHSAYAIADVAEAIARDYGKIDVIVHAIGNSPEVTKQLIDTSRKGYLAALGSSSYSLISLLKHLGPHMNAGGAAISLTYLASEKVVPGYGGGMSSAKAALESDTRTLAWEAGRRWNIRVTTISAGVYASRAARAIGFADKMLSYSAANAPLQKDLEGCEVGATAAFLASSLASGITGTTIYVDNGMHIMGLAVDSCSLADSEAPEEALKS